MRKIERDMLTAVIDGRAWQYGNTRVTAGGDVYLHGHHIASRLSSGALIVRRDTLRDWPTATTISRLRALGASIEVKARKVYLDGEFVAER